VLAVYLFAVVNFAYWVEDDEQMQKVLHQEKDSPSSVQDRMKRLAASNHVFD
jgi:hypothetical protein